MEIKKSDVEAILGSVLSQNEFEEALEYAKNKQQYIYQKEGRAVVLQNWYLIQLTAECARSLALSHFTMDLCMTLYNMEKEHSTKGQSTPSNHIVSQQNA